MAQPIVNVEGRRRHTDSIRLVVDAGISSKYSNNDGQSLFWINNSLVTQYKSKNLKRIYLVLGDYTLSKSKDQDFENSWFLHFRYNQKLSSIFRIEAFIQSQENKILDVSSRNLIGGGIRMKLFSGDNLNFYWGNAYMYEIEKSDLIDGEFKNHRYSSYISFSAGIPIYKNVSESIDENGKKTTKTEVREIDIVNTLYYQPLFNDFGEYRFLEQFQVNFPITKVFNFFTRFDYFYDSITPRGRKQFSTSVNFGFGLSLSKMKVSPS
jgi:hypothetical protein